MKKNYNILFLLLILFTSTNALAINSIVELLKTIQLSNITEKNSENIKNLFLFLLRRNNINHNDIFLGTIFNVIFFLYKQK